MRTILKEREKVKYWAAKKHQEDTVHIHIFEWQTKKITWRPKTPASHLDIHELQVMKNHETTQWHAFPGAAWVNFLLTLLPRVFAEVCVFIFIFLTGTVLGKTNQKNSKCARVPKNGEDNGATEKIFRYCPAESVPSRRKDDILMRESYVSVPTKGKKEWR